MATQVKKTQQSDYSQYTNISDKANASTQTVSNKNLIKPILHSVGLTMGKSQPILTNNANSKLYDKLLRKGDKVVVSHNLHKPSEHKFMQSVSKQTVM